MREQIKEVERIIKNIKKIDKEILELISIHNDLKAGCVGVRLELIDKNIELLSIRKSALWATHAKKISAIAKVMRFRRYLVAAGVNVEIAEKISSDALAGKIPSVKLVL